jgi:hypothetical protein
VGASPFGSELAAAKVAEEMIEGLQYKASNNGHPINGVNGDADDQSVVVSATRPECGHHCHIIRIDVVKAQLHRMPLSAHRRSQGGLCGTVLRWACELGCVGILVDVTKPPQAALGRGHLEPLPT